MYRLVLRPHHIGLNAVQTQFLQYKPREKVAIFVNVRNVTMQLNAHTFTHKLTLAIRNTLFQSEGGTRV